MRKVDHFESTNTDVRAWAWRAQNATTVRVDSGLLWLTIEHCAIDIWLCAGNHFDLPKGSKVWISAEPDAQFTLTYDVPSTRHWGGALVRFFRRPAGWILQVKVA